MKVREKSIKYAVNRKAKQTLNEERVEDMIKLQKEIDNNNTTKEQKKMAIESCNTLKNELEKFVEYGTKGARSKSRWHNEGEKNNIFS